MNPAATVVGPKADGTVLVIDDDTSLLRALRISLQARGYRVMVAHSGEEGLDAAAHRHPDIVLLDLGLPGIDGLEVLHGLRGWSTVPVIVLSARHQSSTKVEALDAGADDFLTKPFGMDELLARIRAALRRATPDAGGPAASRPPPALRRATPDADGPTISTDTLTIDLADHRVRRDGEDVHLTPKEWEIVEVLVRNPGRLVTHTQLLHQVWGPTYETETEYLRVLMGRVRRKLESDPSHPAYFRTEPGMGYRFEPTASPP